MTGGMNYHSTAKSMQALTYGDTSADQMHPRVILISSRVPAAEVNTYKAKIFNYLHQL